MENFSDCYRKSLRQVSDKSLEFTKLISSQVLEDLQANIKIFAQVPCFYNFDREIYFKYFEIF